MSEPSGQGTQGPAILFVHMPKTGGFSFAEALAASLPPERVLGHRRDGRNPSQRQNDLTGYDLVLGHVTFATLGLMRQPARAVSLFRDPYQRALSAFRHIERSASHPDHQVLRQEAPRFIDALRHPALRFHFLSPYTRFLGPSPDALLAARAGGQAPAGALLESLQLPNEVDSTLLRQALTHLGRLDAVGLTSDIAQDGPRCLKALGLPAAEIHHRNRDPNPQPPVTLSAQERLALEPLIEADLTLWQAVRARVARDRAAGRKTWFTFWRR